MIFYLTDFDYSTGRLNNLVDNTNMLEECGRKLVNTSGRLV